MTIEYRKVTIKFKIVLPHISVTSWRKRKTLNILKIMVFENEYVRTEICYTHIRYFLHIHQ